MDNPGACCSDKGDQRKASRAHFSKNAKERISALRDNYWRKFRLSLADISGDHSLLRSLAQFNVAPLMDIGAN